MLDQGAHRVVDGLQRPDLLRPKRSDGVPTLRPQSR